MQIKLKLLLMVLTIITFNIQYSILNSTLWEVNQDGSGDFTTIQTAVNNAADGDSILVYPGRYTETVDYLGKSLSLFSLAVSTGNEEYIEQTVIDGDRRGSVVSIINSNDAYLAGLTLTGGSGRIEVGMYYLGGGLLIIESTAVVENCFIVGNRAEGGGGVMMMFSEVNLRGNTITHNNAERGGGVRLYEPIVQNGNIFCTENKNNIYLNNALHGHEIGGTRVPDQTIKLGKANILHQDDYHYDFYWNCGEITVSAETAVVEQVENDLYVATWGCNDNSGLTPEEPLKSIAYAILKAKADSLNKRTVYIEEGLYSPSATGEKLPLHLKSYVTLTSLTEDTRWTIDAEGKTSYAFSVRENGDITVRNAIFKNGSKFGHSIPFGGGAFGRIFFENLEFHNAQPHHLHHIEGPFNLLGTGQAICVTYRNISIYGNPWGHGLGVQLSSHIERTLRALVDKAYVENIRGKGMQLDLATGYMTKDITLSNSIVTNSTWRPDWFISSALNVPGSHNDLPVEKRTIRIINNTFADNNYETAAVSLFRGLSAKLYNNIIYGNSPNTIRLDGIRHKGDVYFSHNLFEGGVSDIVEIGNNYNVTYDNILSGDPLFLGEGEHPYQLSAGSPAINAGTTDIPGYTFEEYDLAGEPRIFGGKIDLGAYEYQSTSAGSPGQKETSATKISSYAYPNPVKMGRYRGNIHCTISFDMPSAGDVIVAVYNIRGQRVKTLINAYTGKGEHNVYWDGTDNSGNRVGSGMYMYRIETSEMEATGSIMLVK